jgi:hypothetical protein
MIDMVYTVDYLNFALFVLSSLFVKKFAKQELENWTQLPYLQPASGASDAYNTFER